MRTAFDELRRFADAANDLAYVAIGWHVVIGALVLAVLAGWRPSTRLGIAALAAPPASVGMALLIRADVIHGNSFLLLAFALLALAPDLPTTDARGGARWMIALGVALIAFGWVYPYYLAGPRIGFLYAAPVGVLPAPTLAIIVGFTLLAGGFGSRWVPAVLAVWSAIYGALGVLWLGVMLDLALIVGALGLVILQVTRRRVVAIPRVLLVDASS